MSPRCPITGIPISTMRRTAVATRSPPSSLTASAPPSWIRRPAFSTACSTLAWYDMNGMSATTSAAGLARDHRARVVEHVLHRHRQRAVVAEHHGAEAVADQQDLDARLVGEARGREVVRRHAPRSARRGASISTICGARQLGARARASGGAAPSARSLTTVVLALDRRVVHGALAVRQDALQQVLEVLGVVHEVDRRWCSPRAAARSM